VGNICQLDRGQNHGFCDSREEFLTNCNFLELGNSRISIFSNEPEVYRFQACLSKFKCKNFPMLKIYNLSQTQNCPNSLKIHVFSCITYTQRKSCHIKNHQKKLAEIGEFMVPIWNMAGCFHKNFPKCE
jgi:hypothetical protein